MKKKSIYLPTETDAETPSLRGCYSTNLYVYFIQARNMHRSLNNERMKTELSDYGNTALNNSFSQTAYRKYRLNKIIKKPSDLHSTTSRFSKDKYFKLHGNQTSKL